MATQALDTNDMQQVTLGRTLNTATRIPQALLDRRQQEGQFANFQAPSSVVRNVQQPSGSAVGQFFRNQQAMPVYSAQRFSALPQNASDWNNAQWANYFSRQGPSNQWNQETWDMFNMVTTSDPRTFVKSEDGLSRDRDSLFTLNRDPGWISLDSPEFRGTQAFKERSGNYEHQRTASIPFTNLSENLGYWPGNIDWNPSSDFWKRSQAEYNSEASRQMAYEVSMQKAYNALENYAAQKAQWDTQSPGKPFEWPSGLSGADAIKFNSLKDLYTSGDKFARAWNVKWSERATPVYNGYDLAGKEGVPMTLEQIRQSVANTPLLDRGYTPDNLPQYNPSFTVEGARDTVESGKPWVSQYVKQAEQEILAAKDAQFSARNPFSSPEMSPQTEAVVGAIKRKGLFPRTQEQAMEFSNAFRQSGGIR